ncbi:MAG TPA: hypothetical protein VNN21_06720 [Dehalococcoidia bacterium]|nr:hypothetical protein [Dehalococcoidia bacterium]
MRTLLTLGAGLVLAAAMGLWPDAPAEASHYSVSISLYHPTGNATNDARLTCGWHTTCDGVFTDAQLGLDWVWPSNMSYEVRLRLFVAASFSSATVVGSVSTANSTSGCYKIEATIRRTDGLRVGLVVNQHAQVSTPKAWNISGREQGIYNDTSIGSMVWPDNCTTWGRHTMQWYSRAWTGSSFSKNTSIPTESQCWYDCYSPYGIWSTREYLIQFPGP